MENAGVSWVFQLQKTVALSVGEAEYMELASTGQQAAWLISISREIEFPLNKRYHYDQTTKLRYF